MSVVWRIELMGRLRAVGPDRVVDRFRTRQTAALFAYLALYSDRAHARDALADRFWPDGDDPPAVRHRLSVALSSLRSLLALPDLPADPLLLTTRDRVQINPALVTTDVADLQRALAEADRASAPTERVAALAAAVDRYRGELLPGLEEPWVHEARGWLLERYLQALREVGAQASEAGDLARAREFALRAVHADPLREESHRDLMRTFWLAGETEAAKRQYRRLEEALLRELGDAPSAATRALLREIETAARSGTPPPSRDGEQAAARPDRESAGPRPAPGGKLPRPLTELIGREAEVARGTDLLRRHDARLVTLTGPGGSGKTRLAIEVATDARGRHPDGVWFIDLAPVRDPERVLEAIVHALGLQETGGRAPITILSEQLRQRQLLLVLDNFEQILPAAANIAALLQEAPGVKALVTSRASLRVRGEWELPVPPLPVPLDERRTRYDQRRTTNDERPVTDEQVRRIGAAPSVALFVERASAVRPEFSLTPENALAVAAICRRLDGLPLAIELAAARVRLFAPEALLARLGEEDGDIRGRIRGSPLQVLTDGARDLPARQQTLRNTIGWSHALLSGDEQRIFARLSVFAGGFTPEAAEAVSDAEMDTLSALLDQHLIRCVPGEGGEPRFSLLETIREFGQEELARSGERYSIARRHAEFFLQFAEEGERQLKVASTGEWLQRLDRERDNFRVALTWSLEAESVPEEPSPAEIGLRLGSALALFWSMRSYLAEGADWLTRLLATPEAAERTPLRARALYWAADLTWGRDDWPPGQALCEEALALYRELGDRVGVARTLATLGYMDGFFDRHEAAHRRLEECLPLWREIGDPAGLANALNSLGCLHYGRGELHLAWSAHSEALTICRSHSLRGSTLVLLNNLMLIAGYRDDLEVARRYGQECLAVARELDTQPWVGKSLCELGSLAYKAGDLIESRCLLEESLRVEVQLELRPVRSGVLGLLGRVIRLSGEHDRAREVLQDALHCARQTGSDPLVGPWLLATVRQDLGELCLASGDTDGAAACFREALSFWQQMRWTPHLPRWGPKPGIAACLDGLATVAARRGETVAAARIFGATDAVREAIEIRLPPTEAAERAMHLAAVRAALDEAAFTAAWAAGRALSWEEAIAEALAAAEERNLNPN